MSKKPHPLDNVANIFGTLNKGTPTSSPLPSPAPPEAVPAPVPPPALAIPKKPVGRPASGKKSDPEYCQTSIYIRTSTRKAVKQILLDSESERDVSDLIEDLLEKWLKAEI